MRSGNSGENFSMFVVDASVWVARYVRTDTHHQESLRWIMRNFREGIEIYCPTILLPEVAGPIARRTRDVQAGRDAIRQISSLPSVLLVPLEIELSVLSAQFAADLRLKGADAVYVALAAINQATLVTLDDEQRTRANRVVPTMRPSDARPG